VPTPELDGFTIGVTADRRADEQIELLRRLGGKSLHGPTMRTLPLIADGGLRAATDALLNAPPDIVVANTALGIRAWLSAAESWGRGEQLAELLRHTEVVARGPKAAGSLLTIGCDVRWRAPSGRLSEVVDHLLSRPLTGVRIATQRDGSDVDEAATALRAAGADVVAVATYRWTRPVDEAPAARLVDAICDRTVDAVTFTSRAAVVNLFALAGERGQGDRVRAACARSVVPMCVGPVTQEAATAHGLHNAVAPTRALLGAMVNTLADTLGSRRASLRLGAHTFVLAGSVVKIDGDRVELTAREAAVLRALAARAGVVVPKTTLLREVWGDAAADPHALEMVISRLRRQIAPAGASLRTVIRRGYMLDAS
jgi:uroporphyrinogen-III synthase